MTRLTKAEVEAGSIWAHSWRSAVEMLAHAEDLMVKLGPADHLNQPGLAFVREAWAAAVFGQQRGAGAVRLVADNWPDLELRFGNVVEAYEFVEADLPGRERGREYREAAAKGYPVEDWPVKEWVEAARIAPMALRTAAEKKAAKGYPATAGLLIYLNINEFGIRQREVEASFAEAVQPAEGRFTSVWVLWKSRCYRVDRNPLAEPCGA